jgi:hypothetical protein
VAILGNSEEQRLAQHPTPRVNSNLHTGVIV